MRVVMLELWLSIVVLAAPRSEVRVVMLELWLSIMDLAVSRSASSAEILYWSKVVGADDGELVGAFDARTHSADDSEPLSLAQAVFHGASVQSKQAAPLNIQLWAESDARVREGKRRSRRATSEGLDGGRLAPCS